MVEGFAPPPTKFVKTASSLPRHIVFANRVTSCGNVHRYRRHCHQRTRLLSHCKFFMIQWCWNSKCWSSIAWPCDLFIYFFEMLHLQKIVKKAGIRNCEWRTNFLIELGCLRHPSLLFQNWDLKYTDWRGLKNILPCFNAAPKIHFIEFGCEWAWIAFRMHS